MTVAATSAGMLADAEGSNRVGAHDVHWRMGAVPGASRAELSTTARAWLEELVTSTGVFAWQGLAVSPDTGKPRPVGAADADISISHSGSIVVVAACNGARIGVDVESAPFTAFDSASVVRRMCTEAEASTADRLTGDTRRRYLAHVWTAKEAMCKATGSGLATDFRTLDSGASLDSPARPYVAHLAVVDTIGATSLQPLVTEDVHV